MMTYCRSRNAAFFAAGGFAAMLFLSGAAHAITDTIFRYSAPRTGYYSMQGQVFLPRDSTAASGYASSLGSGLTVTAVAFFSTPVHLPQGAKLTALALWYKTKTSIALLRQKLSDSSIDIIGSKTVADGSGKLRPANIDLTSAAIAIDNVHYSYSVQVGADPTGAFYNARLAYTVDNAGD
jgi:hypothetical protein